MLHMKSEGLVEPESYWCVPAAPLLTPTLPPPPPPPFTPCKCVSVNVRVQLPSDVLKMHQSQTGSPELEGIHPRYVVYLVVVCCAGCKPFALIADVKDRSERRDRALQSAMCRRTPRTGWRGQLASIPQAATLPPFPITLPHCSHAEDDAADFQKVLLRLNFSSRCLS